MLSNISRVEGQLLMEQISQPDLETLIKQELASFTRKYDNEDALLDTDYETQYSDLKLDCKAYLINIQNQTKVCVERHNIKTKRLQEEMEQLRMDLIVANQWRHEQKKKIEYLQRTQCRDLPHLMTTAGEFFKNDSLNRLRMIGWLHDF